MRAVYWTALAVGILEVFAQTLPVSWRDDFIDNANRWKWEHEGIERGTVQNGILVLQVDHPRKLAVVAPCNHPYVDFTTDYEIEVLMTGVGAGKTLWYGIAWGGRYVREGGSDKCYDGMTYSNSVLFDGRALYVSTNGSWGDRIERTDAGLRLPVLAANQLRISHQADRVTLYLNGHRVTSFRQGLIWGMRFAILVGGEGMVGVDYILIRQHLPPINLPVDYPRNVQRENLGSNVNSAYSELNPVIRADGRVMYFVRDEHPDNVGGQDVWYCVRQADGSWGPAQNIGYPINNEGANGVISVAPDGNQLLLNNTYNPDGSPKGPGISRSYRTRWGWSVPEEVPIENYYNNDRYQEEALDPTGNVLIMTLQREDTRGEKDLYVCFKRPDGSFSEPQWCGPTICTWGDETTPFIAADGVTLYFATDGLRGYGGTDIWMTRRLDESWTRWSPPVNLGPAINTEGFDAYFTVPGKGDYAYFVSSTPGRWADIYRIRLTPSVAPIALVIVSGRVVDRRTRQPVAARIYYERLTTPGTVVGEAWTDPSDGSYSIALPKGDIYSFHAEAEGYYPISEHLDTRELETYAELERDLVLVPIRAGETIRLNNLFFDYGKAELRPESYPELERLVQFLERNPRYRVEIAGHTDDIGSDEFNLELSRKRAEAVVKYLLERGISRARLRAVGYGESRPLVPNISEENRAMNRRVEFKLLE